MIAEILAELGQDAQSWLARAETSEVKQALREQTSRAQELSIFGAPTFLVQGELFWGSDRFEQALRWQG